MTVYKLVRTLHYATVGGKLRRVGVTTQVLDHTPGGPCQAPVNLPVTVKGGHTTQVPVACGRRLRPQDQCDACRVEVQVVEHRRVITALRLRRWPKGVRHDPPPAARPRPRGPGRHPGRAGRHLLDGADLGPTPTGA